MRVGELRGMGGGGSFQEIKQEGCGHGVFDASPMKESDLGVFPLLPDKKDV